MLYSLTLPFFKGREGKGSKDLKPQNLPRQSYLLLGFVYKLLVMGDTEKYA